jgi:hypothetical protein
MNSLNSESWERITDCYDFLYGVSLADSVEFCKDGVLYGLSAVSKNVLVACGFRLLTNMSISTSGFCVLDKCVNEVISK